MMNSPDDEAQMSDADEQSGQIPDDALGDGPQDDATDTPRRQSMRDRANAPSDTVGTGSYAAITCSVLALLATMLLIAGLLISRWIG